MITAGIWVFGIAAFLLFKTDERLREKGMRWFSVVIELAYGGSLALLTFGVNQ